MEKEKGQIGQGYWIFIRQKIRRQFFFGEKFVLFPTDGNSDIKSTRRKFLLFLTEGNFHPD